MFRVIQHVRALMTPVKPLPLGRWCHPSSYVYSERCDQHTKAELSDYDNSFTTVPDRTTARKTAAPTLTRPRNKSSPVSSN
jgi:hypothetical protein